ncbi:hypothetical protein [Zooshikella harenae]|uniref:Uncharacterized protein n=1 Tax=Zooshikella harenae TaxID=2827238 RepID=A0ABS5ZG91_9GAMM|nr:hypothetical protein [Zooshikella harenae]MBU2713024.1 hypothetical protein [Zooshikella harenae]
MIVDQAINEYEKFIFSPGPPERIIKIAGEDIANIVDKCTNKIIYYTEQLKGISC